MTTGNDLLPIWLQQSDAQRPASREMPQLSLASPNRSSEGGRRSSRGRPASRELKMPDAMPAESRSPQRSARSMGARAPPNPLEQSWDSLEAFKRCTLSRLAEGSGAGPTHDWDPTMEHGGGSGCSSARMDLPMRGGSHARRGSASCDSVPEDSMMQGAACGGGPRCADGGSRASASVHAGGGAGPSGVLANLPGGRVLQMDILSTWGDPHYVGLAGIELFDEYGDPIDFADPRAQLRADPADINVLPGYGHDPRVVSNLVDGVLRTCDDLHLWLAPFTRGARHVVWLDLDAGRTLSMVRVWNYNKSRIHSFRGARFIELRLDDALIFRGEINKAPGNVPEAFACAEPILFTTDARILSRIEQHDAAALAAAYELEGGAVTLGSTDDIGPRPPTAERLGSGSGSGSGGGGGCGGCGVGGFGSSPSTPPRREQLRPPTADVPAALRCGFGGARPMTGAVRNPPPPVGATGGAPVEPEPIVQDYETAPHPCGHCLRLALHSTWGDPHYVGLNGLELLDPNGLPVAISPQQLVARPSSVNELPHVSGDPRTADKLVDGQNATYDDRHMWLAPFTPGAQHSITIQFEHPIALGAVRVWNYAKTAARGVQQFALYLDGALLYQGWMRPAPPRPSQAGAPFDEDFVQTILMTDNPALIEAERGNVYNKVDLEDDLVIIDNGQQISHGAAAGGGAMQRPTTSAVGPGAPMPPAMRVPRRY